MSKMRLPKMDVIRFNESDVIVASGAVRKTANITGIGRPEGDLGIILNGTTYTSVSNHGNEFSQVVGEYLGLGKDYFPENNQVFFYANGSYLNANNVLSYDSPNMDTNGFYKPFNGDYYWDPTRTNSTSSIVGGFVHQ